MMQQTNLGKLASILLGIILSFQAEARHIIGGVITYECKGNGRYDFELKMYRDCFCTNCANFDPEAFIAVYECSGGNCNNLNQNSFVQRANIRLGTVRQIGAPDYPCLIPPNVCVEEATYNFTLNLPLSTNSYHISYQRCCRNITINNIINPEGSGATYTIEITPEAQQACNSSPKFNDFPPIVICAGANLEYDHSATDPDGDQLVYEFCTPLLGGGPITDDPLLFSSCAGAYPNPACPPPYDLVTFRAPNYTPSAPLGFGGATGQSVLKIDPNTGLITGVPELQGQFVVGVCVSEYRNGVLLSKVFRDFQFNVASCDPQVFAKVKADEVIDGQQYFINSCGVTDVTIQNESFLQQFIKTFEWRFTIDNQVQTYNQWSPTVTFPGEGNYIGQLLLNPGTDCGDTATVFVNVFPAIDADFEFDYDTCVAPTPFKHLSVTGSGLITNWKWQFGDGDTSNIQNPNHIYRIPGDIPVSLTVTDKNKCKDTEIKTIPYFPCAGAPGHLAQRVLGLCTCGNIF
ncbi:MAG: PKD domain-containing protein [Saprospiraceae bacterium]|nr:PKD domain-containing protein [Saprospiraceae bacterium]